MSKNKTQIVFTSLILCMFIYTAVAATSFNKLAKYFPLYISITGIVCLTLALIRIIIQIRKEENKDQEPLHPNIPGVIKYTCLLTAYLALVYLIGMIYASAIYVSFFLYFIAKMKPIHTVISVAAVVVGLITIANVMNLYWPKSIFF